MDQLFQAIIGPPPRQTPDWLDGRGCCPFLRGGEMWWGFDGMIVKGFPPQGVRFLHDHFHEIAENWGPIGVPTQVEPHTPGWKGSMRMADQFGEVKVIVSTRQIEFLRDHFGTVLYFFHYPEMVEGEGQPVVVFADRNEPVAFLPIYIPKPGYFLTIEERETLPLFSGTESKEEERGHGY